jgi:hypothetical protein
MLILTGAVLVLLTWMAGIAGLALVGIPLSVLTHDRAVSWSDVRRGLWWGLLIVTIVVMALANFMALSDRLALLAIVALALVGALLGALLLRRRGWSRSWRWSSSLAWILTVTVVPAVYLAVSALGPITNFDSGLYHLSAVAHAAGFPAIPGLANLYAPLGYANAGFPLAAVFESTPWASEGFRLLNGFIVAMVLVDLVIRWSRPRRDAGTYGLLVGTVVLLVPMVALSDYWVTSPSQDSAVFAVTVATSAMVMSAVSGQRQWLPEIAGAAAGAVVLVLLRPTMGAFLSAVLLVAAIVGIRRKAVWHAWRRWLLAGGIVGGAAAVVQIARDYVLSGWLLYPLSVFPFDVPWLAQDPVGLRAATLGYHRDPENLWQSVEGFGWVSAWISRLPQQWEFWLVVIFVLAAVTVVLFAQHRGVSVRARGMLLAMLPSTVMTTVWWLATPPSFRFAWGPVFTLLTIPVGWLLWRLTSHQKSHSATIRVSWILGAAALPILSVTAFSAVARLDTGAISNERVWEVGVQIPYAVAAVKQPETDSIELARGLVVQVPRDEGLCWGVAPLCTPEPDGRVGYLAPGEGLTGGLSRD